MKKGRSALVVGAGFAGSVCAERLAAGGWSVDLIDKRSHVAGNAFDERDEGGILVHRYGPHIFHTNSEKVYQYLSNYTRWRDYEHRVLARHAGKDYPIPINRTTINSLYGWDLSERGIAEHLSTVAIEGRTIENSEDFLFSTVGKDLTDKFFRGYSKKQWGRDLRELAAGVAARVPFRTNDDSRYFTDTYQSMPAGGYAKMFEAMIDSPRITLSLNTVFEPALADSYTSVVYTGPIDEYFDCRFGKLPYRSIRFEHKYLQGVEKFQPTGTINYPDLEDGDYTRITEFKYLTGQMSNSTSIVYEYPSDVGDPYYPVPTVESGILYRKYENLAEQSRNVHFVGRLAQYRYYNMDQVVAAALKTASSIINAN